MPLPQPPVDVSKRLAPLAECVARSQRTITAAAEAGVGAGGLAPANSSMADAQDALDEARSWRSRTSRRKRLSRRPGDWRSAKRSMPWWRRRQDTVERKARAQLATEAEARIAQTAACVDGARQAVRSVSTTKTRNAEVAAAQGALDSAAAGLKQARELLAQNDPKGALGRLDTAQAECQTAQAASEKAAGSQLRPREVASEPVRPRCAACGTSEGAVAKIMVLLRCCRIIVVVG